MPILKPIPNTQTLTHLSTNCQILTFINKTLTNTKTHPKPVPSRKTTIRPVLNHHTQKDWYCCSFITLFVLITFWEMNFSRDGFTGAVKSFRCKSHRGKNLCHKEGDKENWDQNHFWISRAYWKPGNREVAVGQRYLHFKLVGPMSIQYKPGHSLNRQLNIVVHW